MLGKFWLIVQTFEIRNGHDWFVWVTKIKVAYYDDEVSQWLLGCKVSMGLESIMDDVNLMHDYVEVMDVDGNDCSFQV